MTEIIAADAALKAKHRAMWASGDYGAVAREVIAPLGATLVRACAITPGQTVLDVASGTGNAAVPAAREGATVHAVDLVPELLAQAEDEARASGVRLVTQVGDAERLSYADSSFDAVVSCVGVMFAPHHRAAAGELLRVCRPGGTIGLINWTPEGFIGQLFARLRPFVPPPPSGAEPPPRWGDAEHVRALLGEGTVELRCERQSLTVRRFAAPGDFRDFFRDKYGPTMAAYRNVGDDAAGRTALDEALLGLAEEYLEHGRMEWEYLLVTGRRR